MEDRKGAAILGILIGILIVLVIIAMFGMPQRANATGNYTVDGLDGIVTITDVHGNQMTVEADCARVISEISPDLVQLHKENRTAQPAYLEACFS